MFDTNIRRWDDVAIRRVINLLKKSSWKDPDTGAPIQSFKSVDEAEAWGVVHHKEEEEDPFVKAILGHPNG